MSEESLGRETVLETIRSSIQEPVQEETSIDGSTFFVIGDPFEVVIRISDDDVSVAVYAGGWTSPYTSVARPRQIGAIKWRELYESSFSRILFTMVQTATEIRRGEFRKCKLCKELKPPEWMHSKTVCQGCAQEHLGVVY
ncbi:MAG: hypothetical protein R3C11_24860 [Planctomycetaceae bacterium]